jgi:hypothetical protein
MMALSAASVRWGLPPDAAVEGLDGFWIIDVRLPSTAQVWLSTEPIESSKDAAAAR